MSTLFRASEDVKPYKLQLSAIDLTAAPWDITCLSSFLYHAKRIKDCDKSIPIIQAPWGYIIDGWHRVARAILDGGGFIWAKKLPVMPEPDFEETDMLAEDWMIVY